MLQKFIFGGPTGIRTPVFGLRTQRPSPLDDRATFFLAGEDGFEPSLPDPESGVLPARRLPSFLQDYVNI